MTKRYRFELTIEVRDEGALIYAGREAAARTIRYADLGNDVEGAINAIWGCNVEEHLEAFEIVDTKVVSLSDLVEFGTRQTIPPGCAVIDSMGWGDHKAGLFEARMRFPNGPPNISLGVILDGKPVRLVVVEPET